MARAIHFLRSNAIGLLALFIAMSGTAVATTVVVKHRSAHSAKKKKAKRGPAGPAGVAGAPGVPGTVGPTFGTTVSHGEPAFSVEGSIDSEAVQTPIAGKLLVTAHLEGAGVSCDPSASNPNTSLSVDGTEVSGTQHVIPAGPGQTADYEGVTAASFPAGNHTLSVDAECPGASTVVLASDTSGAFTAVVLGG